MIIYVFLAQRGKTLKAVLVPLGVLIVTSIMRKIINRQRPYERYNIPSVFSKTTVGQSLPSRHTASAYIIAMSFLYVSPAFGITALIISTFIAISRILSGSHYISDVLAAAAISITTGIIFFFII